MFDFKIVPKINYCDTFKEFADNFNIGKKDLIITHEFLYDAFIKPNGIESEVVFQERYGSGEPSDEMIDSIYKDVSSMDFDRIIALGGGTIIDISKLFSLEMPDKSIDLFERKVGFVKEKDLVIIPTTCGTGSEVTNISIAEIKSKNTKMGLAVDELYADYAVIIPELIKNLPYKFFATSSVDALIHACEAYLSPKANVYTDSYAVEAISMILNGYKEIVRTGEFTKKELLKDFMIASNYAGIAFANAGVGAVHALSYSIGGAFHVPHGEANYAFFTEVFKLYERKNPEGKIQKITSLISDILDLNENENAYDNLEKLLEGILSKKKLSDYGMNEKQIDTFTDSTMENQQRLLVNSYVDLTKSNIKDIFTGLY